MTTPPTRPTLPTSADDLQTLPSVESSGERLSPRRGASRELAERLAGGAGADLAGRAAALLGAGLVLGAAARRPSATRLAAAAAVAVPLAWRGTTGRWPLANKATSPSVVAATRLVVWRSPAEVYQAWRAFERLPTWLRHVERVEVLDDRRSHWVVQVPGGAHVEWDAEITEDRPGEVLAWRSLDGSPVQQHGSLYFDPWRGEATLLRVDLRLLPPAGPPGAAVAALLQPLVEREIHEDLRRFKSVMEAGEAPTTEGQPHGERGLLNVHNP